MPKSKNVLSLRQIFQVYSSRRHNMLVQHLMSFYSFFRKMNKICQLLSISSCQIFQTYSPGGSTICVCSPPGIFLYEIRRKQKNIITIFCPRKYFKSIRKVSAQFLCIPLTSFANVVMRTPDLGVTLVCFHDLTWHQNDLNKSPPHDTT